MAKTARPSPISMNVFAHQRGKRSTLRLGPRDQGEPRRQPEPVDGGKADHDRKDGEFEQQQPPVAGHNQSMKRADQDPGVDEPRLDQRCDTGHAKR